MLKYNILVLVSFLFYFSSAYSFDKKSFRQLRNEGIKITGWVAGNASQHPAWPQIKPYVGRGGTYYNAFVRVKTPGSNSETEAYMNISLYRKWKNIGRKRYYNEKVITYKIQRANQIVRQLSRMLNTLRK